MLLKVSVVPFKSKDSCEDFLSNIQSIIRNTQPIYTGIWYKIKDSGKDLKSLDKYLKTLMTRLYYNMTHLFLIKDNVKTGY